MTAASESISSDHGTARSTMRAITQERYGSPEVLTLKTVPVPEPKPDEVLVQIHAAGVNPADYHMITGTPYLVRLMRGVRRPKDSIPGMDIAGVVTEVGADVEGFTVGDRVYGENGEGYAEYVAAPARRLVAIPETMSFEQAAATPIAAITALQALRDSGKVVNGDNVMIIGASGGVGTFAVQIAKALGATVTAVCSTRNVEMVESIGADTVIDYTTTSVVDLSERFDAIVDMAGADSATALRRLLVDDGVYVAVGSSTMGNWAGPIVHMVGLSVGSMFRSKKMVSMLAKQTPQDMAILNDMFESGQVVPVMDRTFSLEETPEAIRLQGFKHAQGKSVIVL